MIQTYSESNISASLATFLANQLLAEGYVVYWYGIDAMQTQDGWYYDWSANFATLSTDLVVAPRLANARGMITLMGKTTAKRVYPARPTSEGSPSSDEEAQVPYLTLVVEGERPGTFSGLGDRMRERFRDLIVYGALRDETEQSYIRDQLVRWFDDTTFLPLLDYDGGTLAEFDNVESQLPMATAMIVGVAPEASRYEVLLNAQLRYEV
jgi:hypothetical protein